MKKVTSSIAILWIVLLFSLSSTFALEKPTHEAINEKIALGSFNGFSLDTYLKNNLGFIDGTIEKVNGQEVYKWLKLGGKKEDEPMYTRSLNHFHDPLKTWDIAGFKGTSKSSILWAHDQGLAGFLTGGNFAWKNVREYYYTALTGKDFSGTWIAYSQAEKEIYYGATFRGIGQLMHLVEDASVPAHTRNDSHVAGYHYEKAVDKLRDKLDPVFTNAIANPITFDPAILTLTANPLAQIPIAKIFDADRYDGLNASAGINQGLAEYSNANFFSEDTIFNAAYPYPKESSTDLQSYINQNKLPETVIGEDNIPDTSFYIKKISDGETVDHFVKPGYLTKEALDMGLTISYLTYTLDDVCYKDYASLLIPRAVGYSAGLLDYFFRGTLEITAPDAYISYIYSITDGSVVPQQFTRLNAKVRNSTPDSIPGEEIQGCDIQQQNCIIQAVARYKKRTDYQPDLSTDPPTASSREPDYSYSVSAPIAITSLSSTTPTEFTFDFSTNPIPAGITDLYLHVIFKGTLGNETDIAIAVGMKDLNEPHHFSIWNATDYIYLDKILRTANEIRNNPTLLDRVDIDNDSIVNEVDIGEPYIDPYDVTTEIAFYPTGVTPTIYNATFTPLPPGRYGRIILLTDMPEFYIRIHRESTNPPENSDVDYLFSGVTNQDINGTFQNTQVITFRGIIQHHWSAYAWYFGDPDGMSTAPWPVPANINPYPANTLYP